MAEARILSVLGIFEVFAEATSVNGSLHLGSITESFETILFFTDEFISTCSFIIGTSNFGVETESSFVLFVFDKDFLLGTSAANFSTIISSLTKLCCTSSLGSFFVK